MSRASKYRLYNECVINVKFHQDCRKTLYMDRKNPDEMQK